MVTRVTAGRIKPCMESNPRGIRPLLISKIENQEAVEVGSSLHCVVFLSFVGFLMDSAASWYAELRRDP
jgi:hypothetical protein